MGVNFVLRPNQGNKSEDVILSRVCILGIFCPKQGEDFALLHGRALPALRPG